MKVLFITDHIHEKHNGANIVSKRNYKCIRELVNKNVDIAIIGKKEEKKGDEKYFFNVAKNKAEMLKNTLQLNYKLINNKTINYIIEIINKEDYDTIFFDNSMYGKAIKKIKQRKKNVKIYTFFHDVKINLYKQEFKEKGLKFIPNIISTYINEIWSCKYSDKIICLNNRENNELMRNYGREADEIIPITIEDTFNEFSIESINKGKKRGLFVGTADHFPNIDGIKWFIEKVMPMIDIDLDIVGGGMTKDKFISEKISENIHIIGRVENLDEYYIKADFVICPIFKGAGMKVKVAEALMYGKTIFATNEALIGYDIINGINAYVCNTEKEFIESINLYIKNDKDKINYHSRKLFLEKYSYSKALEYFCKIIKGDNNS